jgi:hypothetical protein
LEAPRSSGAIAPASDPAKPITIKTTMTADGLIFFRRTSDFGIGRLAVGRIGGLFPEGGGLLLIALAAWINKGTYRPLNLRITDASSSLSATKSRGHRIESPTLISPGARSQCQHANLSLTSRKFQLSPITGCRMIVRRPAFAISEHTLSGMLPPTTTISSVSMSMRQSAVIGRANDVNFRR